MEPIYRIDQARGSPEEVGEQLGHKLGKKLEKNIDHYLGSLDQLLGLDRHRLQQEALPWLESLPRDYQVELKALARGAGCSVEKVAAWLYSDSCAGGGCTAFIQETENGIIVGRNNDYLIPGIWNYGTLLAVKNKIPLLLLGLEGGTFSGTGFNQARLWLHYNWLPAQPCSGLPPFIFHRLALEQCSSLGQVEDLLEQFPRDGGMNLFAVDGKTGEYAVLECAPHRHRRRPREKGKRIVAANHYHFSQLAPGGKRGSPDSVSRENRARDLLAGLKEPLMPRDFFSVLADPEVEVRQPGQGTVYSCVVNPAREQIHYAADPYPAASRGRRELLQFSWEN